MPRFMLPLAMVLALVCAASAPGTTVQEVARIQSQGESVLWGIGLVMGLPGTGDSGKDLALARPLAEVLRNGGVPVAEFNELKNSSSVALVMVRCTVPESGARTNDTFDVRVSVINSAKSLKGGTLFLAPLRGPTRGAEIYAVAEGDVQIEDPSVPTVGRVRLGARVVRDVNTSEMTGDSFVLVLRPHFAGWGASSEIAGKITQALTGLPGLGGTTTAIATAIDDRTIRVEIPASERRHRAAFIGDVLATRIDAALLKLPAQVICNPNTGAIIVTGDVSISPVAITHKDLVITTTVPPPIPTPGNPILETSRWTQAGTGITPNQAAKLQDLLAAFKQLNVPVNEQIAILQMLSKGGQLQARIIID